MSNYEYTKPSWFREKQLKTHLPNINPKSILEIGSFEGRSSVWWIENFIDDESKKLTCVDPWLNYNHDSTSLHSYGETARDRKHDNNEIKRRFHSNIEATGKSNQVNVIHGFSHVELPKLYVNGDRFDLIFIDGNHTGSFVLTDAINAWWLLNEGGIIIFDDYLWAHGKRTAANSPKYAIDSFIECFKGYLEVVNLGAYAIIKKKKFNE